MPNFNRDEQTAIDLLAEAQAVVLELGFNETASGAITSMFFGIQTYVNNLALERENNASSVVKFYPNEDEGEDTYTSSIDR